MRTAYSLHFDFALYLLTANSQTEKQKHTDFDCKTKKKSEMFHLTSAILC